METLHLLYLSLSAKAKPTEKPLQHLNFPINDCANKGH